MCTTEDGCPRSDERAAGESSKATNLYVEPYIIYIAAELRRKNAIVEYLDYPIPVTQLKGPNGDGDMQAAKRDCNAPPTRDLNIWLYGRQKDLRVMGVRVSVANFC